MMFNSLGELTADHRPLGSISVQVVFRQGDRTENNNVSRSLRTGIKWYCLNFSEQFFFRNPARRPCQSSGKLLR